MNKLKISVLAIMLSSLISSVTLAAGLQEGFRIGIGMAATGVDGKGSEVLSSGSGATATVTGQSTSATTSEDTTIGHIFAEKTFASGFTFGIDYIPGEADISASRTRTDDDFETAGNNVAKAHVSKHLTFYGLMPLGSSPFFTKVGVISMDVNTTETLATGSTYGDTSVNGITAGIGGHFERDNGLFIRIEANMSQYEQISLTSSASNVITADLETKQTRLSVGKTF